MCFPISTFLSFTSSLWRNQGQCKSKKWDHRVDQRMSSKSGEWRVKKKIGKEKELFLGAWGECVEEGASFLGSPALPILPNDSRQHGFVLGKEILGNYEKLGCFWESSWGILSSFKLPLGVMTRDCGVPQSWGPRITSYLGPNATKPERHDQQVDFISHTDFFYMIDGCGLGYHVGKDCKSASGLSKREDHYW